VRNRRELVAILAGVLRLRSSRDWLEALEKAGVPGGPINDLSEVFDDPQVRARGMRVEAPRLQAGTVPMVASPIRLSATPVREPSAPPLLGQHTSEVLRGLLGMSEAEIERLRSIGVVGADGGR
jgi:formyl-CoA transferase